MTGDRAPTTSLADLVVPRSPAEVAYADIEDADAELLLTANGYDIATDALVDVLALDPSLAVLQAAAARTLGVRDAREAIPALVRLASDSEADETARVQAAYALARLGVDGGSDILHDLAEIDPSTSPAPLQAAGSLARIGDPSRFDVVDRAVDHPNSVVAAIATKQLHAFATVDEVTANDTANDTQVDVYGTFARALDRPEPNIVGEARAQLFELGTDQAGRLLSKRRD